MIRRTPCLGERVSAIADGTTPADVHTRALAHTLTCAPCKTRLDAELAVLAALRASASPTPPSAFLAELIALGGPTGPTPKLTPPGPGMPRPATVRFGPAPVHPAPAALRASLLRTAIPTPAPSRMLPRRVLLASGALAVAASVLLVVVHPQVGLSSDPPTAPLSQLVTKQGTKQTGSPTVVPSVGVRPVVGPKVGLSLGSGGGPTVVPRVGPVLGPTSISTIRSGP